MEIYSPKRFAAQAEHYGLRPGFAVDLEEQKPDATYWDLSREEDVRELDKYVHEVEPTFLTGSLPCDQFSQLQNINKEVPLGHQQIYLEVPLGPFFAYHFFSARLFEKRSVLKAPRFLLGFLWFFEMRSFCGRCK